MSFHRLALSAVLLLGCTTGTQHPAQAPAPAGGRGYLVIVGGGPTPDEITQRFVALASRAGKARIAVLPMASGSAQETGDDKVEQLRGMGAEAFVLNVSREQADRDSVARLLDDATGIWFPGGDQSRITAAIKGTRVERAIRARYLAGAVVGGTSAGAAVMSDPMLTGDERRPGGSRPPRDSSDAFLTIDRDNIVTSPGLGLIDGVIVDQHFLRRKRHNRLVSLVLEHPTLIGVGIDESTALEVDPRGGWRVLGASAAVVYDARQATITPAGRTLGAAGIRMQILPSGSRYEPASGKVELPR